MSSIKKIAVVTGSNKGIGFAIVRALCTQFDGDVILTARDEGRGQQAVTDLKKEGLSPKFHQLDITDHDSIVKLKSFLQSTYGGLDILVNNAGISYTVASTTPFSEQAEVSVKTNFLGTLDVCDTLFPLLRPHARVVNVSSMFSQKIIKECSPENQAKLKDASITMDTLKTILQDFVDATKSNTHEAKGWPRSALGMSKIGVTVMTFIQQRMLQGDPREDIVINACCPGYVTTDMYKFKGHKTIDEGADTPVYLAMLPPNCTSPNGNFVSDRKIQQWG
ncbi:carbonyl reductase [NADPH] 1-like [Gigantopelta aegis]|uniref:carbonyl reductase [NADPH] 1-like n=1 Tax=Gigantopelta aegis TaxID=1735272 RepID=UPI001B88E1F7|nr:carbonyl reductase [NADPH] 1-like [Gigantopelta aegis]